MGSTAIAINNLEFCYQPHIPVLEIANFEVPIEKKIFLYGPSGHGKSTLLNLIAGVLIPQRGSIQIGHQELTQLSGSKRDRLRGETMGYIFQSFNLLPYLTVWENILLPTMLYPKGRDRSAIEKDAHEYISTLNLDKVKDKLAGDLSIGQQQRVAQARALIGHPQLLIADEPTSSLDQNNTKEFMQLLTQVVTAKKMTLLFVSHDRRLEEYFDQSVDLTLINGVKS